MSRYASAVPALACALFLAACGGEDRTQPSSGEAPVETFDIKGLIYVEAISNGPVDGECRPDEESEEWPARPGSELSGVEIGENVTVTNASGEVVGLGAIDVGTYDEGLGGVSSWCTVPFTVENVQDQGDYFGVQIGSLPVKRYERADLDGGIVVDLT